MTSSDIAPHYLLWDDKNLVDRLSGKTLNDFFRSERHFLEGISDNVSSVLDVGCGCGRFLELLRSLNFNLTYTGLDIIEKNIAVARDLYPDALFEVGDVLSIERPWTFDLVNATGVFQHVPDFMELLSRMVKWSNRYVLFDVKFAEIEDHIIDIETSYTVNGAHKAYFNILNGPRFIEDLRHLPGTCAIGVYGYETPTNDETFYPDWVGPFASVGILLEVGETPWREQISLPDRFMRRITRKSEA